MKKQIFNFLFLLSLFASVSAQTKEAQKFDEISDYACDDYLGRTIFYVSRLNEIPNSKGAVVVYEGKTTKYLYDKANENTDSKYFLPTFGLSQKIIKTIKMRLAFLGADTKRFTFIEGGLREKLTVEFWIVPEGATTPKPTPTLEKMKYRKGKPKGFCLTI